MMLREGGKFAYYSEKNHIVKVNNKVVKAKTEGSLYILDCDSEVGEILIEIIFE